MKCKICNKTTKKIFTAKILNKYNIGYFSCPNCKFIQTEEPYWLEESYKDSIAKKHNLFYFYLDDIYIFTEKNLQEDFKLFVEKIELYQSYKSKVKSKTYEDSLNLSSLYKNGV